MTNQKIIDNINGFTEAQKGKFNSICSNKVYNNDLVSMPILDIIEATDTATALDALSQSDIDSNIAPSLGSSNLLSQRPC